MTKDQREIQRKVRILRCAEGMGRVAKVIPESKGLHK